VVNYIPEAQLAAGVPRSHLFDFPMYILCGTLIIGLICNFLVKPVNPKWYMSEDEVLKLQAAGAKSAAGAPSGSFGIGKGGLDWKAAVFRGLRRRTTGRGRLGNTQVRSGAVSITDFEASGPCGGFGRRTDSSLRVAPVIQSTRPLTKADDPRDVLSDVLKGRDHGRHSPFHPHRFAVRQPYRPGQDRA